MFIRYVIINNFQFNFSSFFVLLELKTFDFQIKQKRFLYIYNAIFLSVVFLGILLTHHNILY